MHANHFVKDENVSLTLALASLPISGDSTFVKPGFLSGLYMNGKIYRMGSFTFSKVKKLDIRDDDEFRRISIEIHSFWGTKRLKLIATVPNAYSLSREDAMKIYPHLMAPQSDGYMRPVLMELMNARVWIRFEDDDENVSFESESYPATIECHGEDGMEYILNNFGE